MERCQAEWGLHTKHGDKLWDCRARCNMPSGVSEAGLAAACKDLLPERQNVEINFRPSHNPQNSPVAASFTTWPTSYLRLLITMDWFYVASALSEELELQCVRKREKISQQAPEQSRNGCIMTS